MYQFLLGNTHSNIVDKLSLQVDSFQEGFEILSESKSINEMAKQFAILLRGNFLVTDELNIGLLDFGCVKAFKSNFVKLYQRFIQMGSQNDKSEYSDLLVEMKLITPELDPEVKDQMIDLFMEIGSWFSAPFKEKEFDFGKNSDFMEKGRKIGMQMRQFRKHINDITPEFIFLDRTRYGLLKLFEKMKVKIKLRSKYEFCD